MNLLIGTAAECKHLHIYHTRKQFQTALFVDFCSLFSDAVCIYYRLHNANGRWVWITGTKI